MDPVLFPTGTAQREIAYSPSSCVDDIGVFLERYSSESADTRLVHPPITHRYGPGPRAKFDVFEVAGSEQVHIFIHGGYWQQLSRSDASFPAEGFRVRGITFVAAGYDLAPQVTLEGIVQQVTMCVREVKDAFCNDGQRIVVSGSSAGAHLASSMARIEPVDGLVLLSGIYDLRPLVGTYVNEPLGLDDERAADLSPLLRLGNAAFPPTLIAWGENETAAFKRQSEVFAEALQGLGTKVTTFEAPGRNHFDIVHDLPELASRI